MPGSNDVRNTRYVQFGTPLNSKPSRLSSSVISPTQRSRVPYDSENQREMIPEEKVGLAQQGVYSEKEKLKKEMMAALQEVMCLLDRLAKQDKTFEGIQQEMIEAIQQEKMEITCPVEPHVAFTPSSSSPSSSSPIQNAESTLRSQSEVPFPLQDHLTVLKELKSKLNKVLSYDACIPESVQSVLTQLDKQVDQSIHMLENKSIQQNLKNHIRRDRGVAFAPNIFECKPEEQVDAVQTDEPKIRNSI